MAVYKPLGIFSEYFLRGIVNTKVYVSDITNRVFFDKIRLE